jgi:hypothetical protein
MNPTQAFLGYLQPTTSISGTKVFPGGPRPPAIAKSVAEIAGNAEMGVSVHPMGETAKLRTGGSPRRGDP